MNGPKNNEGFGIIEVVIAMAIFAIGFLAVAAMQINANMKTTSARKITEALELASAQAEFLQGLPLYDDNLDLDGNGAAEQFDMPNEFVDGDHEVQMGLYTIQWTVTSDNVSALDPNPFSSTGLPSPLILLKNIEVRAFETLNPNRILAQLELVKVWEKDG